MVTTTVTATSYEAAKARLPVSAAIALALAMACGGQFVLSRTHETRDNAGPSQAIAGGLLIGGALLFGAATGRWREPVARLDFPRDRPAALERPPEKLASMQWMVGAIVLAAGATTTFAISGESRGVVLAWIGGIAVLFLPTIRHAPLRRSRIARDEWPYLAGLAALLAIALITRVYRLSLLPYNLDGDFASVGLQARAFATGPRDIFAYGWAGIPAMAYLPPALTMMLFGDGLTGLNVSGVVEGLLVIIGAYLLGRDLFHPRVGLFAVALLTISYTHLAASRQPTFIDPVPFLVFSVYLLLLGLREGRARALLASGALAAVCVQMYSAGRVVVPFVVFVFVHVALFNPASLRQRRREIALWALAIMITLGPMLVVFVRDSDSLLWRTREVFILNPDIIRHEKGVYQTHSLAVVLLEQARRSALLFHYYPDTATQFALRVPFLDPFTGTLFTLGAGYALVRWRRTGSALLLAWTALVVLFGGILVANPPFWPHLIVLLPPTALLAALALNQLYELIATAEGQAHRGRRLAIGFLLILLLAGVGVQNWKTYMAAKGAWATPRTRIGRYLAGQPSDTSAYLVSNDFHCHDREFEFLAPGRFKKDLTPAEVEGNPSLVSRSTLLILTPEQQVLLNRLERRYPGGSVETHKGNDPNEVAFYVFRVP